MTPRNIANTIEQFLAACEAPVLLERGEAPILLAPERRRVEVTPRGTRLEAWDEARTWSRRILGIAGTGRHKMELEAYRFGKQAFRVVLLDAARAQSAPMLAKTQRSAFASSFRLFLNRHFGSWRWEAFRTEAKLENSFSPLYPTALLTRGREAVAAVAAPPRDTGFHGLTFALVWLAWVKRNHGELAARRLLLYLPEEFARPTVSLARHLVGERLEVDIWLYSEEGGEYRLEAADRGNIDSVLAPRYSRLAGPAWWVDFSSRQPDLEAVEEPGGALSYRLRGLEVARLEPANGNVQPQLWFFIGKRRKANPERLPEFGQALQELARYRHPQPQDRLHPAYLAAPERWLESEVRRNFRELDPQADPVQVYGQCLGSLGGERSALDLLGVNREGRLLIAELKAAEDIHLPLQAFDYWLRVRKHLEQGDFTGNGYFPGRVLSRQSPRVFLVSPALRFHPMTEDVMQFFPRELSVVRVGVGENWRKQFDVVVRM
jgi:hypothetical protein